MKKALRIGIVGSGPRGMSILERLAYKLSQESDIIVEINLIDSISVGTGKIWRVDQSETLMMNTIAQEISGFSGKWDGGYIQAGNGPSFAEWISISKRKSEEYTDYFPRAYYGEYLQFILNTIEENFPDNVSIKKVCATVVDINVYENTMEIYFDTGERLNLDKIVLATGHAINELTDFTKTLKTPAEFDSSLLYLEGDSVANMSLSKIKPNDKIGIIGMGLGFYDLMSELSVGRGGKFKTNDDGSFDYIPSGNEPFIYAGNRSGLPVLGRGINQKPYNFEYTPAIFTLTIAQKMRKRGNIEFNKEILPLINAELSLVNLETDLINKGKEDIATRLRTFVKKYSVNSNEGLRTSAKIFGITDFKSINIEELTKPFKNMEFASLEDYNNQLMRFLTVDYKEALQGNVNSPLKACLDVLRNTRSVIRVIVDYGGLTPRSHEVEFMQNFAPACNFLAAGPPAFRIEQLNALMRAGIITIVGPDVKFEYENNEKAYYMSSKQVKDSKVQLKALVDSRVPKVDVINEKSQLTQSLLTKGIYTPYINYSNDSKSKFVTGGVNVTQSPFHPIGKDNEVYKNLYISGIPTEHIRWFMQSGSTRPSKWNDFMIDADEIASDILKGR